MAKILSIIIPCYNYAERITYAIESVVSQISPNDELIIIDDGSTDNTLHVLETLSKRFPGTLHVFKQKNSGAGSARNKGIEKSQGDYVLFLDADDELIPGALARFHQSIKSQPEIDLFLTNHHTIDGRGKVREHQMGSVSPNNKRNVLAYWDKKIALSHGAFVAKRALFDRIKYPECLRNGEDIPVFTHLLAISKTSFIPFSTVNIHKHGDSLRNQVSTDEAAINNMVKAVFNPEILPSSFMKYKHVFIARRLLSLSRSLFARKDYRQARSFYCQAIKASPYLVFKWTYLRKFFKSFLRDIMG